MIIGRGSVDTYLSESDVREIATEALSQLDLRNRSVLVIIPDHTRTAPIPMMFRILHDLIAPKAARFDVLVALGTHPPLPDSQINRLLGFTAEERRERYSDVRVFNHCWDVPEALCEIGTIEPDELEQLSDGLMRERIVVLLNRLVLEYNQVIIVGPTFPHEVAGFSGGNKYFFPGVSGADVINQSHWLGAMKTNMGIIGVKNTVVRSIINRAASMINVPKYCFSMVVTHGGLHGLYAGSPEAAFDAAADLSAILHIVYKDCAFNKVLSTSPPMYDDLWVGAKCMYKLEPVVADGGELIIYAPPIDEVSYSHGSILDKVGYHVRDFFTKQMDRFGDVPRAILAHSTHVKGVGTFENGAEQPRINVTLATGIPEERCRRINLGYRDPRTINPDEWEDRENEGILIVRNAGEVLYRLKA